METALAKIEPATWDTYATRGSPLHWLYKQLTTVWKTPPPGPPRTCHCGCVTSHREGNYDYCSACGAELGPCFTAEGLTLHLASYNGGAGPSEGGGDSERYDWFVLGAGTDPRKLKAWMADQVEYGWDVVVTSVVGCGGRKLWLPMVDFVQPEHAPSGYNIYEQLAALGPLVWFNSGHSFHAYSAAGPVERPVYDQFLGRLQSLTAVDQTWMQIGERRGSLALRLTKTHDHYIQVPQRCDPPGWAAQKVLGA